MGYLISGKKIMKQLMSIVLVCMSVFVANSAMTHDRLPDGAKPLSEIVRLLEANGYSFIEEISLEDGLWEAETWKDGVKQQITVDPVSGKIILDKSESSDKTSG